jgi:hypothetical protein
VRLYLKKKKKKKSQNKGLVEWLKVEALSSRKKDRRQNGDPLGAFSLGFQRRILQYPAPW